MKRISDDAKERKQYEKYLEMVHIMVHTIREVLYIVQRNDIEV